MFSVATLAHLESSLEQDVQADVVVVGGGTGGFLAAVAAARTGARTILVEYLPFLGGTHGGGGIVMGGTGFYHTFLGQKKDERFKVQKQVLVRGLALEYMNRLIASGAAYGTINDPPPFVANDVELTKVVIEEMVTESGVDVWLRAQLVDVVVDEGRVVGAIVTRGGGLYLIRTNLIVDASGDGEAAYRAGAAYGFGRESDGVPQPATMMFDLGGVDLYRLLDHLKAEPTHLVRSEGGDNVAAVGRMERNLKAGRPFTFAVGCGGEESLKNGDRPTSPGSEVPIPRLGGMYVFWRSGKVVPTITSHNFDMIHYLDATDKDQLDDAQIEAKRVILKIAAYYRKYIPGFEDSFLLRFAPMLGVRECRRIKGHYTITEQDALAPTDFPDAIGRCGAYIDVHGEKPGDPIDFREVGGERGYYQIPYRSLIAQGVEGVLLAGRLISADHVAEGSIRNQIVCMATGHAAGTAAALCAKNGLPPRVLDVETLQATLRGQDAVI